MNYKPVFPKRGPWIGTGPWVNWYRATQKECITYIIPFYVFILKNYRILSAAFVYDT